MTAPRWQLGALRAAWAGAKSWRDAADRYNAATGVRPPKAAESIQLKCRSLGMRAAWEVVRPDSADDRALREAIRHAVGWDNAAALYNAITGEGRSMEALKSRAYSLGLKLARKARTGPKEGSRATECDPKDILLRAQRIRLFKECHAIRGRRMTDAEMDEALDTDPTEWPDPPPPGRANCAMSDRGAKVYRVRLPRGVAS
mgnify:CR=1 FL=1